ncbi:unnamed protein product [Mytilus edulis]|uniref:Uncharacterized protein n=1 Tax=Mytilus edulis TaxID=6550 RepID=A0A8S3QCU2_MYTED|nr:unnamed protein product [Mytilus edulis]
MVLVKNDSNETLYVKATRHQDLAVQKRIGFEVHAYGEERGAHVNSKPEWHCVQNNGYTQVAPRAEDICYKVGPASKCKENTKRIGIIAISERSSDDFVRSLIFELEQNRDINVRYFKVDRYDYINRFKLHVYEIQLDIELFDEQILRKLHWPEEVAEYYQ